MGKYFETKNLWSRVSNLISYGHYSSVWSNKAAPSDKGHIIEILAPRYVSKPCWKEVENASDLTDIVFLSIEKLSDLPTDEPEIRIFQFYFRNYDIALVMANKVQRSARNKRKDWVRDLRLIEAGGFHDKKILDSLFDIQDGRCYYTGEPLNKVPKDYVIDHIQPIYLGGSDWPINLALVKREINTWKGGLMSSEDTIHELSKERGKEWLKNQVEFCKKVDDKRKILDLEFRLKNNKL